MSFYHISAPIADSTILIIMQPYSRMWVLTVVIQNVKCKASSYLLEIKDIESTHQHTTLTIYSYQIFCLFNAMHAQKYFALLIEATRSVS